MIPSTGWSDVSDKPPVRAWTPGRYRWRTRLRAALPLSFGLYLLVPKGPDCGDGCHEWYVHEGREYHCYHCKQVGYKTRRGAILTDRDFERMAEGEAEVPIDQIPADRRRVSKRRGGSHPSSDPS